MQQWCFNLSVPVVPLAQNKATQGTLRVCPLPSNSSCNTESLMGFHHLTHSLSLSAISVCLSSLFLSISSPATMSFPFSTHLSFCLCSVLAHNSLTLIHHSFVLYVSLSLSTLSRSLSLSLTHTLSFPPTLCPSPSLSPIISALLISYS